MNTEIQYKQCTRCLKSKELTEFYNNPKGLFGKNTYCIQCIKRGCIEKRKARLIDKKCIVCGDIFRECAPGLACANRHQPK